MAIKIQRRYILGFDDGTDLKRYGKQTFYTYQEARIEASRLVTLSPSNYDDILIIDTQTGRACTWMFYKPPQYDPATPKAS